MVTPLFYLIDAPFDIDVHVVNVHLCAVPECWTQNDSAIDMMCKMTNASKVTLHFETSEIAVAVVMGSATQLPSITCQDMWSANRRQQRFNVTVMSCLVFCDSGKTIKPQAL